MAARVEVLPGAGTVIRFGELTVWAGPAVSADLLSFLAKSARNVAASAQSGQQVTDHVANILNDHDPEPGAPFAVVGPSGSQWDVLLHGPVQAWDGTRWWAPNPDPGWLRASVVPQPAISVGPAGSPSPRIVMDSPYDLAAGMVPGGGVIVLPGQGLPSGPEVSDRPLSRTGIRPNFASGSRSAPGPGPGAGSGSIPGASPGPNPPVGSAGPPPGTLVQPGSAGAPTGHDDDANAGHRFAPVAPPSDRTATPGGPWPAPDPAAGAPRADGSPVDLRDRFVPPRAPLPFGLVLAPADRPLVSGIRCPRGHFNRANTGACACCRSPIAADQPEEPGPRPTLGVLLADDGAVYRLQRDLLIGSDPSVDLAAAAGTLDLLAITSEPGLLAPAHAELRLHEWTLRVVDRGSAAGTFVSVPGSEDWTRLTPYTPVDLSPGSHLSLGQRVLTYLSPWT